jgi:hypothetical protein
MQPDDIVTIGFCPEMYIRRVVLHADYPVVRSINMAPP